MTPQASTNVGPNAYQVLQGTNSQTRNSIRHCMRRTGNRRTPCTDVRPPIAPLMGPKSLAKALRGPLMGPLVLRTLLARMVHLLPKLLKVQTHHLLLKQLRVLLGRVTRALPTTRLQGLRHGLMPLPLEPRLRDLLRPLLLTNRGPRRPLLMPLLPPLLKRHLAPRPKRLFHGRLVWPLVGVWPLLPSHKPLAALLAKSPPQMPL